MGSPGRAAAGVWCSRSAWRRTGQREAALALDLDDTRTAAGIRRPAVDVTEVGDEGAAVLDHLDERRAVRRFEFAAVERYFRHELAGAVAFHRLADVEWDLLRQGRLLTIRVRVIVRAQVLLGHFCERVLIAVEFVKVVCRVVQRAARLDSLVGTGLDAEGAVHAEAEVDLVAVDVEGAVFAG